MSGRVLVPAATATTVVLALAAAMAVSAGASPSTPPAGGGPVTGADIANGSLTSRDLRNGTLAARDWSSTVVGAAGRGGLPGPVGEVGAPGPAGTAGFGWVLDSPVTSAVPAGATTTVVVDCPSGRAALGGAARWDQPTVGIIDSRAVAQGQAWSLTLQNTGQAAVWVLPYAWCTV